MEMECKNCKYEGNIITTDPCRNCCMSHKHWWPLSARAVTPDWYQAQAMRTAGEFSQDEYLINAALGLAGESGEVADIIKKYRFQGHELDTTKLIKELGDVQWYIALAASALGVSLGEIMMRNIEKLRERYTNGFEAERSIHRTEESHETESEP